MRVAFSPQGNLGFGTDAGYNHYFMITLNSFNFGACSISNVEFEFSSSNVPGSGTNNSYPVDYTACDSKKI